MKKILVDGKEITTNYGEKSMCTLVIGDNLPNYELYIKESRETNEQFFKGLYHTDIRKYGFPRLKQG